MDAMAPEAGLSGAKPPRNARRRNIAYWQAAPFALPLRNPLAMSQNAPRTVRVL